MTDPEVSAPPDGVTEDAFLGGRLSLLQPRGGYRAGTDAVLLAAAIPAKGSPGERVLDAGAGVGAVGLCLAARVAGTRVMMAESEPRLVELARCNVARNALEGRVEVVAADVASPARTLTAAGLAADSFAHVAANPPFNIEGRGRSPRHALKARAHAMPAGSLGRWVRFLTRVAAPGGTLSMIHRPDALPELLGLLEGRFGALRLLPVHPRRDVPAVRVIIQGLKGSRAPLSVLPGLVLHRSDNRPRPEIVDILRHGASLALA